MRRAKTSGNDPNDKSALEMESPATTPAAATVACANICRRVILCGLLDVIRMATAQVMGRRTLNRDTGLGRIYRPSQLLAFAKRIRSLWLTHLD